MNKHLRIGVQAGVSFGIIMTVFGYFQTGSLATVPIYAATGVFFGAMVTWFSSSGERRLKTKGITATDLSPIQVRTIDYPGTPREAVALTKQALRKLRKLKDVTETSSPLSLQAKTGLTFESFGEKIVVHFSLSSIGTRIQVSSKPRISTTRMDMGRGVENVETIVRHLLKRGATRRVP
ncbi:DUF1499 domain-containing protein [Leptolyngbya sp. PCC 6406]|uniref:DUF1499 domain-containing protein n=1 Tax=Leptolyngbya sp. PCC 6406 TaxID=1173264 RepID=UPI0002ACFE76|nr:DUF1499 domain-containing protein [Leptolyngbya sp. PCC 6406]